MYLRMGGLKCRDVCCGGLIAVAGIVGLVFLGDFVDSETLGLSAMRVGVENVG